MAYNNGFPMTYPQYYPQFNQPQMQQNNQLQMPSANPQNNSIIWVQGEAGAKSYLVGPNTTVQLWDSEDQVIYLKSADASGMPSMKILDYTIRDNNPQNNISMTISNAEMSDFVRKGELQAFEEKIQKQLEKLSYKPKKEVKDDE